MSLWRDEKMEYLKSNRDYSRILDDGDPNNEMDFSELAQEKQEFYRRRQKLKELVKEKGLLKRNGGAVHRDSESQRDSNSNSNNSNKRKALPNDKTYGSFFGPSKPPVSRSLLEETRNRLQAGITTPILREPARRPVPTTTTSSRPGGNGRTTPSKPARPVISKATAKAQKLKEARDFSFLFSDNPSNNTNDRKQQPVNKSDSRPSPSTSRPSNDRPRNGQVSRVSTPPKSSQARPGPGQPSRLPPPPSRLPPSRPPLKSSGGGNASHQQRHEYTSNQKPSSSSAASSRNGQRNMLPPKHYPASADKQRTSSEISRFRHNIPTAGKIPPGRNGATAKQPQVKAPLKSSASMSRPVFDARRTSQQQQQQQQQKRFSREDSPEDSFIVDSDDGDDDEGEGEMDYRAFLPKEFRMRRSTYDDDDDDRNMVADFRTIQAEEKNSARIAREEDERELRLIEEEERRERMRKKRKL